ncbi:HlyD family efflux transporter periplasmic adaptor subunit [Ectothiorhodospiraceae bacterium 2226]|nr:HlyD family efflux transporter periplasmic adaptor subunit [Ectothiorhodospiraceae bacterium 2226]
MSWRRRIGLALLVLLIVGLLVWGFRPAPLLVDTEAVRLGHLALSVEDEGHTRVVDRYEISAPIAGQNRRVTLEVGDPVREGAVVVTLDALPAPALDARAAHQARARVSAAESTLATAREEAAAAQANARLAQEEVERVRRLAQRDLTSRSAVDQAEAAAERSAALLRSAEARVRTATFELEVARAALAYAGGQDPDASGVFELRAPVAGQVLQRHVESSRVVQAGEPLLEIGDPRSLEVAVDVLSLEAVRIEPGMRVLLERWGRPEPLEGRVHRVEPVAYTKISALGVEEQRVWVIARFTDPPERWARLGDGYRVNARFILWEADDVLQLPTSALFRHDGGWAVFVVEDEIARLRRVEPGQRAGLHTQIMDGVVEGERVIVHPSRDLAHGARVRVR